MLLDELKLRAEKYEKLTERALSIVEITPKKGTKEFKLAKDFIEMARNYLSDGKYHAQKGDLVTALASYSYAHAWIDAGVRAGMLEGKGNELFA